MTTTTKRILATAAAGIGAIAFLGAPDAKADPGHTRIPILHPDVSGGLWLDIMCAGDARLTVNLDGGGGPSTLFDYDLAAVCDVLYDDGITN